MQRYARPGALLAVLVLVLLTGALSHTGPATALGGGTTQAADLAKVAADLAKVAAHPDDDTVAQPAATQHVSHPTAFGLPAEDAPPPSVGRAGESALPRHLDPAAPETGTRRDRAPPAVDAH